MTAEQAKTGLKFMQVICEAVRSAGEYPSGHIYAAMCEMITLAAYESLIQQLCRTGLISRRGNLLVWTGPKN